MIQRKKKTCKGCNRDSYIYAKGLCGICYSKERSKEYRKREIAKARSGDILDRAALQKFYRNYWEEHTERICYECGCNLYKYHSWHILHIIPKRLWKKYLPIDIVFNPENIRYGCLTCHDNFDNGGVSPNLNNLKNKLEQQWEHLN